MVSARLMFENQQRKRFVWHEFCMNSTSLPTTPSIPLYSKTNKKCRKQHSLAILNEVSRKLLTACINAWGSETYLRIIYKSSKHIASVCFQQAMFISGAGRRFSLHKICRASITWKNRRFRKYVVHVTRDV